MTKITAIALISAAGVFLLAGWAVTARLDALEARTKFICSLPIVTDKAVLMMREREGKWVFDGDMDKYFYYVPGGCS